MFKHKEKTKGEIQGFCLQLFCYTDLIFVEFAIISWSTKLNVDYFRIHFIGQVLCTPERDYKARRLEPKANKKLNK